MESSGSRIRSKSFDEALRVEGLISGFILSFVQALEFEFGLQGSGSKVGTS
jgi:hypothetical protein